MSTITAILEPAADGSLHLPVPEELRHRKIKVVAELTAVDSPEESTPAAMVAKVREWAKDARGSVRLPAGKTCTGAELAAAWTEAPHMGAGEAAAFEADLESSRSALRTPASPWD